MENLEQTVEKSFLGKVKNNLRRVRDSVAGKVTVYSLAGILSAGLGYGCKSKSICWEKIFGGSFDDKAYSIQQTNDLGYIVAGETESKGAGETDAWIIKLAQNGDLLWDKTFGGKYNDRAKSIQQTTDGGYIAAGSTYSKGAGSWDVWILKPDSNGNLEWDKTFGGYNSDDAYSIQQTKDLGYIVAGTTQSKGTGKCDAWIIKLAQNGDLLWDKTFGGKYNDRAKSIQQTTDLGYIVAGRTKSKGAGTDDAWILKLDQNGNLLWDKTFGGSDYDWAESIQQTSDGGYVVAGGTYLGAGKDFDAWILKLDQKGDIEWDKTFGGSNTDWANSIQQTIDGGYIAAGETWSKGAGSWDVWILKLDSNGNLEWDKTFGRSDFDKAHSIQQTKDGGYIVAGTTKSKDAGWYDAWVLKLDEKGNLDCK